MGDPLKPTGTKVKGWARNIDDEIKISRTKMARFMASGPADVEDFKRFMWVMLTHLDEAQVNAQNILEANVSDE